MSYQCLKNVESIRNKIEDYKRIEAKYVQGCEDFELSRRVFGIINNYPPLKAGFHENFTWINVTDTTYHMYDPIRIYRINFKSVPWFSYRRSRLGGSRADMNACWTDSRSATGSPLSRELPDSSRESRCNVCIMHAPVYVLWYFSRRWRNVTRATRIQDFRHGEANVRETIPSPPALSILAPPLIAAAAAKAAHRDNSTRVSDLIPSRPLRVEGFDASSSLGNPKYFVGGLHRWNLIEDVYNFEKRLFFEVCIYIGFLKDVIPRA